MDHTDVVAAVKNDLTARGINLNGPCGAFEITRRVAWRLRGESAGVLHKPTGNNCQGFAVDIIVFPDGTHFDILINAETENKPAWQLVKVAGTEEPLKVDPGRWRAPTDPDPVPTSDTRGPGPSVVVPPTATAPAADLTPLLAKLDVLAAKLDTIAQNQTKQTEEIKSGLREFGKQLAQGGGLGGILDALRPR